MVTVRVEDHYWKLNQWEDQFQVNLRINWCTKGSSEFA